MAKTIVPFDTVGKLIDYEDGALSLNEQVELFSELIASGMAWSLQGHYGRTAYRLIEDEVLDGKTGAILVDLDSDWSEHTGR